MISPFILMVSKSYEDYEEQGIVVPEPYTSFAEMPLGAFMKFYLS